MTEHVEIERSYLLRGRPELPARAEAWRVEQGYLPPQPGLPFGEGRLRRITARDGSVRCFHTIKRGAGVRRTEVERRISVEEFLAEWPRTRRARLTKTRYRVPVSMGGLDVVWEIDVFEEIDLVLAEVELPDEAVAVTLPAWLAPHVVREVTDEPAYRNYAIATRVCPGLKSGGG